MKTSITCLLEDETSRTQARPHTDLVSRDRTRWSCSGVSCLLCSWSHLVMSGDIWSCLVIITSGHTCLIWSCLALSGNILSHLVATGHTCHIWLILFTSGHMWSGVFIPGPSGHMWSGVVTPGPSRHPRSIWSQYGQVWSPQVHHMSHSESCESCES